jgi:hypothetical protein
MDARLRDQSPPESNDDSSSIASSKYSMVANAAGSRSGSVDGEEEEMMGASFSLDGLYSSDADEDSDNDLNYSIEEQSVKMNPDGSFSALECLLSESSGDSDEIDCSSDESIDSGITTDEEKDGDELVDQVEDWHHRTELFDVSGLSTDREIWHHREDLFDASGITVDAWAGDDPSQDFRTAGNANIRTIGLGPL